MADTKISALPLATTPLVGTEVLPIVQSGTTDQVSIANLTSGRTVDFAGAYATNATAATLRGYSIGGANTATEFGFLKMEVATGVMRLAAGFTGWGGQLALSTNGVDRATISSAGNVTLNTGNLVISDATKGLQLARGGEIAAGGTIGPSTTRTVTIAMGGTGSYSATIQVGMNVYGGGGHARAMWMVGGDVQNNNAGATAVVGPTNTGNCVISAITLAAGSVSFTVQNTNGAQNGRVSVSVTYSQSDGNTATVTIA